MILVLIVVLSLDMENPKRLYQKNWRIAPIFKPLPPESVLPGHMSDQTYKNSSEFTVKLLTHMQMLLALLPTATEKLRTNENFREVRQIKWPLLVLKLD